MPCKDHLTTIPTLLGEGVRLFAHGERKILRNLVRTQTENGMGCMSSVEQ